MKTDITSVELTRVLEWAKEKAHDGSEPPWAWFQYMKLIEVTEAILAGATTITEVNLPQSALRLGNALQLVVCKDPQDSSQSH